MALGVFPPAGFAVPLGTRVPVSLLLILPFIPGCAVTAGLIYAVGAALVSLATAPSAVRPQAHRPETRMSAVSAHTTYLLIMLPSFRNFSYILSAGVQIFMLKKT
jgi:multisubunit Na+/H+ antiporter MnhB subunit